MDGSENRKIVGHRPSDAPWRRWQTLLPLGATAVVLAAIAGGLAVTRDPGDPERARIASLSQRAERLRGLKLKRPVTVERVQRADLSERFGEELTAADDPDLPGAEAALRLMNFLDDDVSLADLYSAGAEAGVLGFYDPETQLLSLVENKDVEASGGTILHEIVHAIQDQNYDLDGLTLSPDDDDAALAARALIEGDATEVELRFFEEVGLASVLGELGGGLAQIQGFTNQGDEPSIPYLNRLFTMPYVEGAEFVTALRERGGQELVDRAFRAPPKTTKAVLQPEIYGTDADRNDVTELPPAPAGFDRIMDTTFGAADVYALTEDLDLAKSWTGGRIAVDRDSTRGILRIAVRSTEAVDVFYDLRDAFGVEPNITIDGDRVDLVFRDELPADPGLEAMVPLDTRPDQS